MTDMDEITRLVDAAMNAAARRRGVSHGAGTWLDIESATAECEAARASLLQRVEALREESDAKEVEAAKADSWRQAAETYRRERDDLREAAKLAWAFCHEAQQRITVDDDFRARAEVAFSLLDRVLYPPGYPASSATGVCWDCQVGGPDAGPCSKFTPAPSTAPVKPAAPGVNRCGDRLGSAVCSREEGHEGVHHDGPGNGSGTFWPPASLRPPENKEDPRG